VSRTTHTTFCRIGEALCGLEVEVTDGRITTIRPDRQHVTTQGHCCAKGLQQHLLYDSPDRLTNPLKRTAGGRFEPVSWETALAEIGAKVRRLRSEHGPDALALYLGTAGGQGDSSWARVPLTAS
jgi:anaerobic selenocysteine-containing dehydrogenase